MSTRNSLESALRSHPSFGPGASSNSRFAPLRVTRQREFVYDVLMSKRDHPTATEVFVRVKKKLSNISLATVYNCLETLVQAGVARRVNLENGAARYCPNKGAHGHFHCVHCGKVEDVPLTNPELLEQVWQLPEGSVLLDHEITLRGVCPDCQHD
ncbi:MAG: Fur family transcriptional regulator [Verrucomicrobiales bacterium]